MGVTRPRLGDCAHPGNQVFRKQGGLTVGTEADVHAGRHGDNLGSDVISQLRDVVPFLGDAAQGGQETGVLEHLVGVTGGNLSPITYGERTVHTHSSIMGEEVAHTGGRHAGLLELSTAEVVGLHNEFVSLCDLLVGGLSAGDDGQYIVTLSEYVLHVFLR